MKAPPVSISCQDLTLRFPVYGVDGAWVVVPADFRAHGKDERLPVESLYDNVVHRQLMLSELAGK